MDRNVPNCNLRHDRKVRAVSDKLFPLIAYCEKNNIDFEQVARDAIKAFGLECQEQAVLLRRLGMDDAVSCLDDLE